MKDIFDGPKFSLMHDGALPHVSPVEPQRLEFTYILPSLLAGEMRREH
jgi:hypothetical protein